MSDEKKYPNSGILSRNDRQRDGKNDPPYKGNCDVDCPHCGKNARFWLSAWVNEGKSGKFFGLRFTKMELSGGTGAEAPEKKNTESVPF